ncbi:MAG: hypothetical protein LUC41_01850 [Clostridiales bacterium]|nr:hypothetical protein [Clostridiales bacterium]
MKEIYIDPNALQEQIDAYKDDTETVSGLKYAINDGGLLLQSIDKYNECLTAMNDLISEFSEFALMDADTLQKIRAKWMDTDSDIATMTLGEILSSKIKK